MHRNYKLYVMRTAADACQGQHYGCREGRVPLSWAFSASRLLPGFGAREGEVD